jgi:heme-degrading monooxygenase HmoA
MLPFLVRALQSGWQAKTSDGNLAVSVLRQPQRTFWTRTVWSSEEAMKSFMLSGTHRLVMRMLLEWCDEAALVHWVQDSSAPPAWTEAHSRLQREGRTSKVNYPSDDHRGFRIAALSLPVRGETTLK